MGSGERKRGAIGREKLAWRERERDRHATVDPQIEAMVFWFWVSNERERA